MRTSPVYKVAQTARDFHQPTLASPAMRTLLSPLLLSVALMLGSMPAFAAENPTDPVLAELQENLAGIEEKEAAEHAEVQEKYQKSRVKVVAEAVEDLERLVRRHRNDMIASTAIMRALIELDNEHTAAREFFTAIGTLEDVLADIGAKQPKAAGKGEPTIGPNTDFLGNPIPPQLQQSTPLARLFDIESQQNRGAWETQDNALVSAGPESRIYVNGDPSAAFKAEFVVTIAKGNDGMAFILPASTVSLACWQGRFSGVNRVKKFPVTKDGNPTKRAATPLPVDTPIKVWIQYSSTHIKAGWDNHTEVEWTKDMGPLSMPKRFPKGRFGLARWGGGITIHSAQVTPVSEK